MNIIKGETGKKVVDAGLMWTDIYFYTKCAVVTTLVTSVLKRGKYLIN